MGNTWEIHGKYMGNTWEIHGKYMGTDIIIVHVFSVENWQLEAHLSVDGSLCADDFESLFWGVYPT